MKIKQSVRYQLNDWKTACGIFYFVVLALSLITTFLLNRTISSGNASISGMENATYIFLFIIGLNAFKTPFRLHLQSGISRTTFWLGFVLSALCLSAFMSIMDALYPLLLYGARYNSFFMTTYGIGGNYSVSVTSLLWGMTLYFAFLCAGFFITTLYYRMNKALKVLVSVGVPVLLFIVLPLTELYWPSLNLMGRLFRGIGWALGLDGAEPRPVRAAASLAVCGAILSGLSYCLVRGAMAKDS